MSIDLEGYRVFMASPGGLEHERAAFREAIQRYNHTEAIPRGLLFIPMGWEDARSGVGRPQALINQMVRDSDYLVLVLWNRWGSPTDTGAGGYSSGTEEEYRVAMESYADRACPMRQVVLLFKAVDPVQLSDAGPQLQRVLDFKQQIEQSKQHLWETFDTVDAFRRMLRSYLGQWAREWEQGVTKAPAAAAGAPALPTPAGMAAAGVEEPSRDATTDSLLERAWALADSGHVTRAEVAFSRAVVRGKDPAASLAYGRFLYRLGRLDQATVHFECAREIGEEQGDHAATALAYGNLGNILLGQGDLAGAEANYRLSLEINEDANDREGIARAYGNLGNVRRARRAFGEAEEMFRRALAIYAELGNREGMARINASWGVIHRIRGDADGAEAMHRKALALYEELEDLEGIAEAYGNLGNVAFLRGDLVVAEEMHRKTLEINEQLGRLEGIAKAAGNLGNVLRERGDLEEAERRYRQALGIADELGYVEGLANAYGSLGVIRRLRGELASASEYHLRALALEEQLGRLDGMAEEYTSLGDVLRDRGDRVGAREMYEKALELARKVGMTPLVEDLCLEIDALGSPPPPVDPAPPAP